MISLVIVICINKSLLWSFDKKLYLIGDSATDSGVLTDDTKLTLVDANNNDKTYHRY